MSILYRANFTTMTIRLQSNEELGILDSGYLEDYFGNDGQITLYHIDTDTSYPILMVEQPDETPEIPFDVFVGIRSLASLPDGDYEIRGRCRDVVGNYTIMNSINNPLGTENTTELLLTIKTGSAFRYEVVIGNAVIRLGYTVGVLERDDNVVGVMNRRISPIGEIKRNNVLVKG